MGRLRQTAALYGKVALAWGIIITMLGVATAQTIAHIARTLAEAMR